MGDVKTRFNLFFRMVRTVSFLFTFSSRLPSFLPRNFIFFLFSISLSLSKTRFHIPTFELLYYRSSSAFCNRLFQWWLSLFKIKKRERGFKVIIIIYQLFLFCRNDVTTKLG